MNIFVTGVNGQLGYDVARELLKRGHFVTGSGSSAAYRGIAEYTGNYVTVDITDPTQVCDTLYRVRPDAVVHCAAWTNVDGAEEKENIPKVYAVNEDGTRNIAEACRELGCKMLYVSTDYVFDGQGTEPWDPDCKNFAPLNEYGKSKLKGELAVANVLEKYFIVRTAWVFGLNGKNFVKTMLRLGQAHDTLRVVNDQIGTPTYTCDLARLISDMIETDKYGFYHATNEGGYISWYDFACEIFRQAGMNTRVIPVTTAEYGQTRAVRPLNSRLGKSKLEEYGFDALPDWTDALHRYLVCMKETAL
ncbi:MAG: dTDP-4-dehydrorhamnose reductase [Eubacteriales bacterium]|nr:dTDP-4-dehydrorhamnose reductase [Eubacteriales bacterium]